MIFFLFTHPSNNFSHLECLPESLSSCLDDFVVAEATVVAKVHEDSDGLPSQNVSNAAEEARTRFHRANIRQHKSSEFEPKWLRETVLVIIS